MMVELLVRWTDIQKVHTDETEAYLKKIIDGDEDQHHNAKVVYSYSAMTFNIRDVIRFNKAGDAQHTTIRFADNTSNVVKVTYRDFQKLYVETTGLIIQSFMPEGYIEMEKDEDIDEDDI